MPDRAERSQSRPMIRALQLSRQRLGPLRQAVALITLILSGCGTPVPPPAGPATGDAPRAAPPGRPATLSGAVPAPSTATTERAYRQDAARHLYRLNAQRIFTGKLPPLLYAVGVLQVHLDRQGQVTQLHWMRAPRHAPEVMAEIERTVRQGAPYPVAARLGRVVYTDTWLWDKSGRFQLDTLTEGQL